MTTNVIKTLRKARFEALSFSRKPYAKLVGEELEWYSDENENIIATLIQDKIDNDWGFIILGRDERGLFRCIDSNVSFSNISQARNALKEKVSEYALSGQSVFPQGEINKKKNIIYKQVAPSEKLHPHFKKLVDEEAYSPAKEIIREIIYSFEDPTHPMAIQSTFSVFSL